MTIPNGYIFVNEANRFQDHNGQTMIEIGTWLIIHCTNGFFPSGLKKTRCQSDGAFEQLGTCIAGPEYVSTIETIQSPKTTTVRNTRSTTSTTQTNQTGCLVIVPKLGHVVNIKNQQIIDENATVTVGTQISLKCNENWRPLLSNFSSCQDDQTWTSPIQCIACDSHNQGRLEWMEAARSGNLHLLEILLFQCKVDINLIDKNNWTALIWATSTNITSVAEWLLQNGADVNLVNSVGSSALLFATMNGNWNLTQYLVWYGADVNVVNKFGSAPLLYAAKRGDLQSVMFLVNNLADLEITDSDNTSALIWAVRSGDLATVEFLFNQNRAWRNHQDKNGRTALIHAAALGLPDIVNWLLEANVDANVSDTEGKSALDYALDNGHAQVVAHLRAYLGH